jgi:DNA-directed RNA polymerase specialized sigma24 family protein
MYWRSRRRRLYRTVDTAILESVAEPRRPAQETADLLHDLESVVANLPTRCQDLFRLRYRLGCEPPEAARRMGYRTSSIYKVIERCLAALTRELVASGLLEKPSDA